MVVDGLYTHVQHVICAQGAKLEEEKTAKLEEESREKISDISRGVDDCVKRHNDQQETQWILPWFSLSPHVTCVPIVKVSFYALLLRIICNNLCSMLQFSVCFWEVF